MKKTLLLSVFFGLFALTVQASFPVNKANVEKAGAEIESLVDLTDHQQMQEINLDVTAADALSPAAAEGTTSKGILVLLALATFILPIALHRWIAKKPAGWNILFILTLGGLGIWWLVDLINILTDKF